MPSCKEHIQKYNTAKCVQLILQHTDSNKYADWIVTTAFYQALHLIDAFFAFDSDYHPEAHNTIYNKEGEPTALGRNYCVKKHNDLRPIRDNYSTLFEASIDARYEEEIYKDDPDEVNALLNEDLDPIVTHIRQLIGESQFQS